MYMCIYYIYIYMYIHTYTYISIFIRLCAFGASTIRSTVCMLSDRCLSPNGLPLLCEWVSNLERYTVLYYTILYYTIPRGARLLAVGLRQFSGKDKGGPSKGGFLNDI